MSGEELTFDLSCEDYEYQTDRKRHDRHRTVWKEARSQVKAPAASEKGTPRCRLCMGCAVLQALQIMWLLECSIFWVYLYRGIFDNFSLGVKLLCYVGGWGRSNSWDVVFISENTHQKTSVFSLVKEKHALATNWDLNLHENEWIASQVLHSPENQHLSLTSSYS